MKTKIIATIGPACQKKETLAQLLKAGASIFRLNFSHGAPKDFIDIINNLRELEQEYNQPITILQDLSGPKIRIGTLKEASLAFIKGEKAYLGPKQAKSFESLPFIPFSEKKILEGLDIGDKLVLADGTLVFSVIEKHEDGFTIQANNNGIVTSRKGLALPGKTFKLPALTDKDRENLIEGLKLGVDAIALSYVQTPEDVLEAKAIIKSQGKNTPVCAKLERQNAVDRLDEILEVADIIMVARGDLGIECPLPKLPAMQKRIIKACNNANKPVIVATQMLLSMVNNPSPTRAETTDVANAVLDGADCVMLSEETAMGNFPVETVQVMNQITTEAEQYIHEGKSFSPLVNLHCIKEFLSYSACLLANKLNAKAIVAHSLTGASGRSLSAQRPPEPIYVLTTDPTALRYLNFSWGVIPQTVTEKIPGHLERVEFFVDTCNDIPKGSDVVLTAGQAQRGKGVTDGTNLVKLYRK